MSRTHLTTATPCSVLLMDDEIASADIVQYAIGALEQAGCEVSPVARMSEAMDAFYQRFYNVFVLDIDMSQLADVQEGDGTDVARFLQALDRDTRIIVFSARGDVHHWFAAANAHVYGYVFKNQENATETLVKMVQKAASEPPASSQLPRLQAPPEKALLVLQEPTTSLSSVVLRECAQEALPGWSIHLTHSLKEAAEVFADMPGRWGLIGAFSDRFSARPSSLRALSSLCQTEHSPHVILGCHGETGHMTSILHMVNARPFRLLNLLDAQLPTLLVESFRKAVHLYGHRERLHTLPEWGQQLRLGFSAETMEAYCEEPDPDDLPWTDEEPQP